MINELLSEGKENAIPARELIAFLNIPTRDFYSAVEKERRQGVPICASKSQPAGFYLAANQKEARDYIRQVNLTAHEMRRTARLMGKGADKLPEGEIDQ